jgi:RNA-splicing ligase RtcB
MSEEGIFVEGEYTTAQVQGREDMFDEAFFNQVQEIVDHEAFQNDIVIAPDGHAGAGAVIGFTMPLGDRVTPNTVGSDIGCGVTAVNIEDAFVNRPDDAEGRWDNTDEIIRKAVPMGLGQTHSEPEYHIVDDFPWERCQEIRASFDFEREVEYGKEYLMELSERVGLDINDVIASMGTLGSGNHFLEISQSEETRDYWIVVHSGSRCVGGSVAGYWQSMATERVESEHILDTIEDWMWEYVKFDEDDDFQEIRQWVFGGKEESFYDMEKVKEDFDDEEIEETRQSLLTIMPDEKRETDLDYLDGELKERYITDMIFAQQYARENRMEMIRNACNAINVEFSEVIDSIHNYIDFEDRIIRKGATKASEDQRLIIPFNMAEGAVICLGKGKASYNYSAPHGAGRRGSRTWAYDEFDVEMFEEEMEGVYNKNDNEEILDEIPSAYKDSADIMDFLEATAEVEEKLNPILNMKGE